MNIKQEIEELKTRIEQLEAECKAVEESEWPNIGNIYYLVDPDGQIRTYRCSGFDFEKGAKAIGNIFRTQQEAEAEVEARKVIAELRATEGRVGVFPAEEGWGIEVYANCVEPSSDARDFFTAWNSEENAQQAINQVGEARIIAAVKHFGRV